MSNFIVKKKMGLIQACFYGETNLQVYSDYFNYLAQMDLPDKIKILHDHRQSDPTWNPAEADLMIEMVQQYMHRFTEVRIAYVSDRPKGIALAMLLKSKLSSMSIKTNIFSEKKSALKWLENIGV
ncbi:STAS/SEC14 domain-containing protein [Sunxiuqinia sp. sy24]|uniref:STAS/SEC14 domain-containing protein n=1 Tax=Sunxiuqinia sp. sy24 TaxID=3461495 RepID=UPI0040454375